MNNNTNVNPVEAINTQLRIMERDIEGARSQLDRIEHERERMEYALKALDPRYYAVKADHEEVIDHE